MALEMIQTQTLNLKMSPALYQAISLLQYTNTELVDFIKEQAMENPLIHLEDSSYMSSKPLSSSWHNQPADKTRTDIIEETISDKGDYRESLYQQANVLSLDHSLKKALIYLIDSLSDHGYLEESLELLAEDLNIDISLLNEALAILQSFEPAGIGARSLQECLLLQLKSLPEKAPLAEQIVSEFIDVFITGDWSSLSKELGVTGHDIQKAVEMIQSLHPNPVDNFEQGLVQYIIPDVTIKKDESGYRCIMEDYFLPQLSVNFDDYRILRKDGDKETRRYLQKKYHEAQWLVQCLSKRKQTLLEVTEVVIERQRAFLEKGPKLLKTLTLGMVAEELGVHESTVSRAIKNKHIQTPHGLFPYKELFVRGVKTAEGSISTHDIKETIKRLIASENPAKPLSDQAITMRLKEKGIQISRRAVAKYRSECGILSSTKRKRKD
ncbi:RNA polymerase sigma-54 factor [Scopulibacillus daqui]|uniref:RNA polymerase sigma-54 factor n=1 Tax=Scopulibacillus daqui TaxID=1469162 RepID=A0ABS2PY56_9BACL|nr:RNA polymerase factor sigma-54 [Scopulibacillus daqui]MBM7644979.1 RNA polymerase sigma-54 factor [Scopulibacillus daqui]